MSVLIDLLEQFNRKERFFLIREALDLGEGEFQLSEEFRKKLGREIGLDVEIPPHAFVAMDYHLDWIAASVAKFRDPECKTFLKPDEQARKVTQRDVDLLITFKSDADGCYRLIFLEAKGYNYWDNGQMKSKAVQLKKIFGQFGEDNQGVKPYFCLVSQSEPTNLKTDGWPDWMWKKCKEGTERFYWLKLCLPGCRLKVTASCDCENSTDGDHFHIKDE